MAEIPVATTLEDNIVLAQRVELLVSGAVDAATTVAGVDDKFTTMRETDLDIVHPETRINHGLTRVYGHGAPDIGIRGVLTVSQDLFAYLKTRSVQGAGNVLPTYAYALKCTSQGGTSKTIAFKGKLTEKRYRKRDAEQGDATDVEIFIRVVSAAEPSPL